MADIKDDYEEENSTDDHFDEADYTTNEEE